MADLTLTQTHFVGGIWHGVLTGAAADTQPRLAVSHRGDALPPPAIAPVGPGEFSVSVPVPVQFLADGVQTFVITDPVADRVLASFVLLAGEALAEDIRAEVDLLRDELDMLKRAFRRHCLDTAPEE